ncbi:response regulator transcription factor [Acidilutibacter cellobiosedens]|jgi:two-component system KDP operon response regulator KdpE|uniref:Response regulator transcription factor n=1 Tax=Acidilutibacter cellobiosedens TaxID=2507161 RepID=A0A410QH41_9FIRM|nr:response regulator transcription factor [Acidilutibacter cellobiosedens]MBE6081163.1 response regulator [Tissierellaceae bacterium]QAT63188.1 response regulator transcription factor [Acidilutibacter cellobiosedens]
MDIKPLILIIEDEDTICNFISAILNANGYQVTKVSTGKEGISMAASYSPDVILLDLGLPDIDGIEVLRNIRQWSKTPIVVVSARGYEREKVEALDLGADDYIVKPFGTSELLARIRTAIRHSPKSTGGESNGMEKITIGELEIDYSKRRVSLSGRRVHLTPVEYKILSLLSRNAGKVLTHDYIMREVWGLYTNDSHTLRVNMANIRRKLEENPAEPKYILTEVGVGYRMVEELHQEK